MNLAKRYAWVGAAWGAVFGYGLIAVTSGFAVTLLWMLFPDYGTMPEATETILYTLAAIVFALSVGACGLFGYLYGQRLEERMDGDEKAAECRRTNFLTGGALVVLVVGGHSLYVQERSLRGQQAYLNTLVSERHAVRALSVFDAGEANGLRILVTVGGERSGAYELELAIADPVGRRVFEERRELTLEPGESPHRIFAPYEGMLAAMRLPPGTEGRLREVFNVTATLTTALDGREARRIPAQIRSRYLAPDSPFHHARSITHPLDMAFEDGRWVVVRP